MGDSTTKAADTTTDKAPKAKKEKKPSFFKGLKTEYKKIVFADRRTVAKQTVAVLVTSVFLGVLIAVLDLVITKGLGFIL